MSDGEHTVSVPEPSGRTIGTRYLPFLAEASALLGASLDYAATLQQVADLAVPQHADRCGVYVIESDGVLRPVAVAHRDPDKREEFWDWLRRFPPDLTDQLGVAHVARTGRAVLCPTVTDEVLRSMVRSDQELAAARRLAPASLILVPLMARGRSFGVLSLSLTGSPRRYGPDDLAMAEELGRRAGQAVEHALLYRQAQEAIAAKDEALALLDTLFSSASIGIGFWDRQLRFVRLNEALAALNGVPVADHIGRTVREVLPGVADAAEPVLLRVMETGEPLVNWELRGETPAAPGVERYWLESLYPVRGAGGQVIGIGAVATEITDMKRAEAERAAALAAEQAARAEAEAALRALDQFVSFAAHDLQNPLATIKAAAQLLQRRMQRGTAGPHDLADGVATIAAAATRMGELLGELLDVAGLRTGRSPVLDRRSADLVGLVRRVVVQQQQVSDCHQIHVRALSEPVFGHWDGSRLERVVSNLVANAIKYSPDGGDIEVMVGLEEGPPPVAWVSVRDSGIGIAAEDLPRIFTPFYRGANAAGRFPGAGLGLSGAQAIVAEHGGTLTADSQVGAGSVFTLRLPLAAGPQQLAGDKPSAGDAVEEGKAG